MRKIHCKAFIALVALASMGFAQDKPNIVLIYADDISARELPIYGSSVWSKQIEGEKKVINSTDASDRAITPAAISIQLGPLLFVALVEL